jgi:hypothetical protein
LFIQPAERFTTPKKIAWTNALFNEKINGVHKEFLKADWFF